MATSKRRISLIAFTIDFAYVDLERHPPEEESLSLLSHHCWLMLNDTFQERRISLIAFTLDFTYVDVERHLPEEESFSLLSLLILITLMLIDTIQGKNHCFTFGFFLHWCWTTPSGRRISLIAFTLGLVDVERYLPGEESLSLLSILFLHTLMLIDFFQKMNLSSFTFGFTYDIVDRKSTLSFLSHRLDVEEWICEWM